MTSETIVLNILGLFLLAAIGLLFTGGRLIQRDRTRNAVGSHPRIIEDLRWLQDLLVDFIARTNPFARLLSIVTAQRHPVAVNELWQKAHGDGRPAGIEWAALWIMRLGGLIRFTHDGVRPTEVGREVQRRINTAAQPRGEREFRRPSLYDSLFVPIPVDKSAGLHLQSVREASREKPPEFTQWNHAASVTGIGELRKPLRSVTTSHQSPNSPSTQNTSMKKRTIIMTPSDHEELTYAIAAAGKLSERGRSETNALEAEIARAKIVDVSHLPPDVITMNSRAELLDLDTGERMEFTLVFPIDADIEAGKISVLAPLGTAMLGYRVNDEFRWTVPYGIRRLKVTAVRFQPEAAFAMAA
jgi:regulator of nucleoside diphosphate kinase